MITDKIKQILTDSGCTMVFYEQAQLANLYKDQTNQVSVNGLIIQPDQITLEVKANAIHEHYNPLTIEVTQQARLEDQADNNEVRLQALLDICKQIIVRLIATEEFKTQTPYTVLRVLENKYDANVIGWALLLDLYYLLNENKDPCL
jgi:hypothetical protein